INANTHVTKGTFIVPNNGASYSGSLSFDPTANTDGPTARGIIDGQLNMNGTLSLDNSVIGGIGQLVSSGYFRGTGKVSVTSIINGGTIASDGGELAIYGNLLSNLGTVKNMPNSA